MGAFPTLGYRDLHGHLGQESNEIVREFYVQDFAGLTILLQQLLGTPQGVGADSGQYFPSQCPFAPGFYCTDVDFEPLKEGCIQGSMHVSLTDENVYTFLNQTENLNPAGGLKVTATYRPMTDGLQSDEMLDYSGQVMSIISNAPAQDKNFAMTWEDGTPASQLKGMTKIIPKLEIIQKTIYLTNPPPDNVVELIGSVNAIPFSIITADSQGNLAQWEGETLLFMAMPSIRRWRWDGNLMYECTVKLAAMVFQDTIYDGLGGTTYDFVGWNRLYNVYAQPPQWEYLYLGGKDSKTRMYAPRLWNALGDFLNLGLSGFAGDGA